MTRNQILGANIDTWLINVKGKLPDGLAEELDLLKEASQEADEDIPTRWTFAGEMLFIRAHGSGSDSGAGFSTVRACTLTLAAASSITSSVRHACPPHSCGNTR